MSINEKNKSTGLYEYILGQDEYFVYTNEKRTFMVTYGSGTLITTKSPVQFTNDVVDLARITKFGLSALQDNWNEFGDSIELTVTEQEFYTVTGEGSSVTVSTLIGANGAEAILNDEGFKFNMPSGIGVRDGENDERWFNAESSQSYEDSTSNAPSEISLDDQNKKVIRDCFVTDETMYGASNDDELDITVTLQRSGEYKTANLVVNRDQNSSDYTMTEACNFGFKIINGRVDRSVMYAAAGETALGTRTEDGYPVTGGVWKKTLQNGSWNNWELLKVDDIVALFGDEVYSNNDNVEFTPDSFPIYTASHELVENLGLQSGEPFTLWYTQVASPGENPQQLQYFETTLDGSGNVVQCIRTADQEPESGKLYYELAVNSNYHDAYFYKNISDTSNANPVTLEFVPATGELKLWYNPVDQDASQETYVEIRNQITLAKAEKNWSYKQKDGTENQIGDENVRYFCKTGVRTADNVIQVSLLTDEDKADFNYVNTNMLEGARIFIYKTDGNENVKTTISNLSVGENYVTFTTVDNIPDELLDTNFNATVIIGLIKYTVEEDLSEPEYNNPDGRQWTDTEVYPSSIDILVELMPNTEDVSLAVFNNITYKNPGASTTSGEEVNISSTGDDDISWNAQSFFALETSNTKTPELKDGQKVTIYYVNDSGVENEVTVPETQPGEGEHVFVNMSEEYVFGNNKKSSTIYYAEDGTEQYPSMNITTYDSSEDVTYNRTRQNNTKYTSIQIEPKVDEVYTCYTGAELKANNVHPQSAGYYDNPTQVVPEEGQSPKDLGYSEK